jgi:hypothetical protein
MRHNPGQAEGRSEAWGWWADTGWFKRSPGNREKALQCRRRGIMPALSEGMKSLPVGLR